MFPKSEKWSFKKFSRFGITARFVGMINLATGHSVWSTGVSARGSDRRRYRPEIRTGNGGPTMEIPARPGADAPMP